MAIDRWVQKFKEQYLELGDPLQKHLASFISETYNRAWEDAGKPGSGPGEYFAQNPGARKAIQNAPAPWQLQDVYMSLWGKNKDTEMGQSVDAASKELRHAKTFGEVEHILARSTITGILPIAQKKHWNAYDPEGAFNASIQSYLSIVEDLPSYNPNGPGNFLSWALGKVGVSSQSKMIADDFLQNPFGSKSIEAANDASENMDRNSLTAAMESSSLAPRNLDTMNPEEMMMREKFKSGFSPLQRAMIEEASSIGPNQRELFDIFVGRDYLQRELYDKWNANTKYDARFGGDWKQRITTSFNQSSSTEKYPIPFMGTMINMSREEVLGITGMGDKGFGFTQLQLRAFGAVTAAGQKPLAMNYPYGNRHRQGVQSPTTFDAIINGERSATTRWGPEAEKWKAFKTGDVVAMRSGDNRTLFAQITQSAYEVNPLKAGDEEAQQKALNKWSKLEGWSANYGREEFTRKGTGYQIQYRYLGMDPAEAADNVLWDTKRAAKMYVTSAQGGGFNLVDEYSNEAGAQQAFMNSERRYEAPGTIDISESTTRPGFFAPRGGVKFTPEEFGSYLHTGQYPDRVSNLLREEISKPRKMLVANNMGSGEFNEKFTEWPDTLEPWQYQQAVRNFGAENVPYEPIDNANGEETPILGYRLLGQGPLDAETADDWIVDRQLGKDARQKDTDVFDEYGLRGGEENESLATRINKAMLMAFKIPKTAAGAIPYIAGRQLAETGRVAGYMKRFRRTTWMEPEVQNAAKGVYAASDNAAKAMEPPSTASVMASGKIAIATLDAQLRYGVNYPVSPARERDYVRREKEGKDKKNFLASALRKNEEVIFGEKFENDDFMQHRYVDRQYGETVHEARVLTLGHEFGHLEQRNMPEIFKKIFDAIDKKDGIDKYRIQQNIAANVQNSKSYINSPEVWAGEVFAREVFADAYAGARTVLTQQIFSEEEFRPFAESIAEERSKRPLTKTQKRELREYWSNAADEEREYAMPITGANALYDPGNDPEDVSDIPAYTRKRRGRKASPAANAAVSSTNAPQDTGSTRNDPYQLPVVSSSSTVRERFSHVNRAGIAANRSANIARAVTPLDDMSDAEASALYTINSPEYINRFGRQARAYAAGVGSTYIGYSRAIYDEANRPVGTEKFLSTGHDPETGDETGNVTVAAKEQEFAGAKAQSIWNQSAMAGNIPGDPKSAMLTLQGRSRALVTKWVQQEIEALEKADMAPGEREDAKIALGRVKKVIEGTINRVARAYEKDIEEKGGDVRGWKDIEPRRLKGVDQINQFLEARPGAAPIIDNLGGPARAAAGASTTFEYDGAYYQVGDQGYGNGRGQGQYARNGPNKWGGGPGNLFYSAYLMKRMFAMTISPSIQEAEYYGQKIDQPLAEVVGIPMETSREGTSVRASLTKDTWSRGAWEQFGGFTNAGYAISQVNPALPRIMSGLGFGAGLMGAGAMANMMLRMTGVGAELGPVAMGIGVGAGALTMGGVGIMEMINAMNPTAEPWTLGRVAEGATQTAIYGKYEKEYREKTGKMPETITGGRYPVIRTPPVMQEEVLSIMPAGVRATYEAWLASESPDVVALRDLSGGIKGITGEEVASIAPAFRALKQKFGMSWLETNLTPGGEATVGSVNAADRGRIPSPANQEFLNYIKSSYEQEGLIGTEAIGRIPQIAEQLGYGFQQGQTMMENFIGMDPAKRKEFERRAGQVARYGSSLGTYYDNPRLANRLADKYNITSLVDAMGAQSLMGAAAEFGYEGDEGIGPYKRIGPGLSAPTSTVGEEMEKLSKKYGSPYRSGLAAQLSTQLQSMGVDLMQSSGALGALGIQNQPQLQATMGWLQSAQTFGSKVNPLDIASSSTMQNPWQTQVLGGMAQQLAITGNVDMGVAQQALSGLGLTNRQVYMLQRMSSGDLGAWSYNAQQNGTYDYRFMDRAGSPIQTTDMSGFLKMLNGQRELGNPFAPNLNGSGSYALRQLTGITDTGLLNAFMGGTANAEIYQMQRQYGYQQQQYGLQTAQMASSWGYQQQQWGLQDATRSLQYNFQQADFAVAGQRLGMENAFAERQEALSWKQIELQEEYGGKQYQLGRQSRILSHENSLWNLQFSQETSVMQQGWTREDWAYQDTVRSLQTGWNMDDINEQIRYSSGRQRRQLVKQRDRTAMMTSLETGQIEETRDRQEVIWKREDERYKVQEEYINKLIALDQEQFNLSEEQRRRSIELEKEQWQLSHDRRVAFAELEQSELERRMAEYQQMWELQQKSIEAERNYQIEQHDYQVRQFELQKKISDESYQYQIAIEKINLAYQQTAGYTKTMIENDPSAILKALGEMATDMKAIPPSTLLALTKVMKAIASITDATVLEHITEVLASMQP